MKKVFQIHLTTGQGVFLVSIVLIAFVVAFYLGARFGPEMLWGIRLAEIDQNRLLPAEVTEEELENLIKQTKTPELSFHDELQDKTIVYSFPEPVPVKKEETKTPAMPSDEQVIEEVPQDAEQKQALEDMIKEDLVSYTLQVGSFFKEKQAEKLKKKLESAGFTPLIQRHSHASGQIEYRLLVGEYSDKDQARIAQQKIAASLKVSPVIVEKE